MGDERRLIYWDACVFIAWTANEVRSAEQIAGLASCVDEIRRDECVLITSAITLAEVLEARFESAASEEKFQAFLRRSNVEVVPLDHEMAMKARRIRNHFQALKASDPGQRLLTVPDAIHLATAVQYGVSVMHTFDGCKKDIDKKKPLTLLELNGNPVVGGLVIEPPKGAQSVLPPKGDLPTEPSPPSEPPPSAPAS